ncbi:MAG: DUF1570 domain-containing protein, partial [Planctomycetes bacterium]|nr:DUF1570 domain-containing protein [Planctomycetota bacterium]
MLLGDREARGKARGVVSALFGVILAALVALPLPAETDAEGPAKESAEKRSGAESALVIVVLEEGQELVGEIVAETKTQVTLKTSFGTFTLARDTIKEIRRDVDVVRLEWEERFRRFTESKDVAKLLELADWAGEKGLREERSATLGKVLQLDPANEAAHGGLGHARLDGAWVDEKRVQELLAGGYALEGLELVKKDGASATGVAGGGGEGPLTKEEQKRREKERKKAEKFRKRKEQEFEGVPWDKHFVKKTPHYEIHCNSTLRVTEYYAGIMEKIFESLSKRFTGSDKQTGRSAVFIYKTKEEFYEKNGFPPNAGIGAYYNPANQTIHGYHGTFALTGSTFGVLCHEAVHQFQGRKLGMGPMNNMPVWLIEGMAVYFGDGARIDYEKNEVVSGLVFRDRLLGLKRRIAEGTNERLARLIEMQRHEFGGAQYGDAWGLIHFLFSGPEKEKGRELLKALWQKVVKNETASVTPQDFRDLAENYFGGVKELEEKVFSYVKSLPMEPNGIVEGEEFASKEFMFRVMRPSADWTFNAISEEDKVLVDLAYTERRAAIRVELENKEDISLEDEEFVDKIYGDVFQKRYKILDRVTREFTAQDVEVITYVDRPPAEEKP